MVIGNYQEVELNTTPWKQNKKKSKFTRKKGGKFFSFLIYFQKGQKGKKIFLSSKHPP